MIFASDQRKLTQPQYVRFGRSKRLHKRDLRLFRQRNRRLCCRHREATKRVAQPPKNSRTQIIFLAHAPEVIDDDSYYGMIPVLFQSAKSRLFMGTSIKSILNYFSELVQNKSKL